MTGTRYRVFLSRQAERFLEECREDLRRKIVSELRDLENWPFLEQRHDLKKIRGRPRTYRIRVGRVRAIFTVDRESREILVLKVEERERAYR